MCEVMIIIIFFYFPISSIWPGSHRNGDEHVTPWKKKKKEKLITKLGARWILFNGQLVGTKLVLTDTSELSGSLGGNLLVRGY